MSDSVTNMEERIEYLEGQILELQKKNLSYEKEKNVLLQTVRDMYEMNKQVMVQVSQIIGDQGILAANQRVMGMRCDNMIFEYYELLEKGEYFFPIIKSRRETIEEIIKNKKSIARCGDGEFSQIVKVKRQEFQRMDDKLGLRLKEVLDSHHPNILIAIANNYGSLEKYTDFAADGIRDYMTKYDARKQQMELLEKERIYYDAYMSRPYVMHRDCMTDAPKKRFEELKKIWEGRDVLIVEGAQTRMGVGNDLMDGTKTIKRILAPATSSFDRYDDILKAALKHAEKDMLILVAMGPSAGVLAYDLTLEGYQALDIGHLDLEYEWFLAGEGKRVPVPYKYNNEIPGDEGAEELCDPVYEGQIVADCS